MFAPIRPSPIIPSCMTGLLFENGGSRRRPEPAGATDQGVRRAVVAELRLRLALELRDDPLGQHLAQLDAPLVEGVDLPDRALGEDAVLVEGDELAERL